MRRLSSRRHAEARGVICEKPLTGYFGPEDADDAYRGDTAPKKAMFEEVVARLGRIGAAVRESGIFFGYAENFVYTPRRTERT